MFSKPNQSAIPLTKSGQTPSVTGLAMQRMAQGPDPLKFAIAGGRIRVSTPNEDSALIGLTLENTEDKCPKERDRLVLETAEANLRAGISFLDAQSSCLEKISSRLGDAARIWKLSRMPGLDERRLETLQDQFIHAREEIQCLKDVRQGTVPLFSDGQSSPIRLYHPSRQDWHLFLIERSDLGATPMVIFSQGKIYGDNPGFHLDLESIQQAIESLAKPKAANRMQNKLLSSCLTGVMQRLAAKGATNHQAVPAWSSQPESTSLFRSFN
jgi:hypothetical protein